MAHNERIAKKLHGVGRTKYRKIKQRYGIAPSKTASQNWARTLQNERKDRENE